MMPTTIASELSKHLKIEYLETLPSSELAFWLINSFHQNVIAIVTILVN